MQMYSCVNVFPHTGEGGEDAQERTASKRPRDDLDEEDEEPGDEDEQNEEMREGKQRFRGEPGRRIAYVFSVHA